jgi:hypothetical protein
MFLLGTLLSANAQVPSYVPSNGLVGWYPFNGNANDESGNGNNGTVNGATLVNDRNGNLNSAYDFNKNSISIPANQVFTKNPMTYAFWFNKTGVHKCSNNVESWQTIFSTGRYAKSRDVTLTPNNDLGIGLSIPSGCNNAFVHPTNISLNDWNHGVVILKYDTVFVFINGVLKGKSYNIPCSLSCDITTNYIGASSPLIYSCIGYFIGKLDDIGIWNRALSSSEVMDLYNACQLSISAEPANQSSSINNQAQFTSFASDTNASYQWQSSQSNLGWVNVPSNSVYSGVTTKKITINNIKLKNHEQLFRVIATKNTCKDTSVAAMLTVNDTCITNVYDTVVTSTTDTLYIKVNTSSLNNPIYNTVKVYPNPSSTQVIIDNGNYSTMGSYTAKIVNTTGQQVFQSVINQQQFVIDAKTMGGAGVYTLYITDANNKVIGVKKIVLQ